MIKAAGNYEVQDWEAGWEDDIEPILVNGEDEEGKKLENGKPFETGLRVDRNCLGGYRIDHLTAKVLMSIKPIPILHREGGKKPTRERN